MFVQELILEGFKSYATRTVISGWDNEFNAITGLNGSGKSNILDAICFVLGISSLSHVRATQLQDLVYKKGQAGITKASVTIIFNNEDRKRSPVGYENCKQISITRQIIVGGRNKYIVNGHNKNQQDVASLFQSVQLNVNNPHFLIMQGKITKVLNMKPPEILAMIEEAAGTRMFEDRKEKALKTMEKKDAKLMEITSILDNEIIPKFNKLREAKRAFLEFQKLSNELGSAQRTLNAYEYTQANEKVIKNDTKIAKLDERLVYLTKSIDYLEQDILELEEKVTQLLSTKSENSGVYRHLEEQVKEISKELALRTTKLALCSSSIQEERKNVDQLVASKAEIQKQVKAAMHRHEEKIASFAEKKEKYKTLQEHVAKLEKLVETLTVGLSASEGQDHGYMDQLREAKKSGSQLTTEIEQSKIRIDHIKKELSVSLPKVKTAEKQLATLNLEVESSKKVIDSIKLDIENCHYDAERETELRRLLEKEKGDYAKLESQLHDMERSLQGLTFQYTDPSPRFDRGQVKGLVAELIILPEEHKDSSVALEVCAGGKLYNVIVSSETVGSQLLQKGNLRKRVTIIPLNKISAFKVAAEKITTAKKQCPGSVFLALDLVGFDDELLPAMNYVFGSTLVCKDSASAKAVTFHKDVKMRSVTFDGDTYDPSGQLSGGSRPSSAGLLLKMGEYQHVKKKFKECEKRCEAYTLELDELGRIAQHYQSLVQKLELKEHSNKLLQEKISSNVNAQMIQHIENLKAQLEKEQKSIEISQQKRSELAQECKRIEAEMKDFSANREGKLASLREEINQGKQELSNLGPNMKEIQLELDMSKAEFLEFEKEEKSFDAQINALTDVLAHLQEESMELERQVAESQSVFNQAEKALLKEKSSLASFDKELTLFESEKKEKKQELENSTLEIQQIGHDRQTLTAERSHAFEKCQLLEREQPWISDQKGTFNFTGIDIQKLKANIGQMEQQHSKLSKSLDTDVMQKYDRLEKKEASLKQMVSTVVRDKKKIEETITSLDEYKREALIKTYDQVNHDFGLIFGDLLAGNSAKLEPPPDQDITEGLEVKVCLGGVWKQSLTELSGGQRSLIALSLILSLLQFKPAPMYILDEVDSALDLSHTQNIGHLLKTRFKGSQFIIVSLKDGMFNNANVLFRTKFRDGVSTVDRIAQRSESKKT